MAPMVAFIVFLIYAIPSIILYAMTVYVIYRYKTKFKSSFFQLYCYDCVVNFITFLKVFTTLRLPEITCYNCFLAETFMSCNDYLPMAFIFSTGYQMAFIQYGITTLISLNRLSVLLNHNLFEPLWKKFSFLMTISITVFPFLSTRAALNYDAEFSYVNTTDYYLLTSKMPVWEIYSSLIPFMVITIIISLSANFTSFIFVKHVKLIHANRAELNFLTITTTTCVIQVIGTFMSIGLLTFGNSSLFIYLSVIRPFVSDGLTLVQPWLLYFFSSAIRNKINKTLGRRKPVPTHTLFKIRSLPDTLV